MTSAQDRICQLAAHAGRHEICTEDCPLWEHGQCSLEPLVAPGVEADREREPLEVS